MENTNSVLFNNLCDNQQVRLNVGQIFNVVPATHVGLAWDRIEGMILGLAVGDALGNETEGIAPAERIRSFGEIRDYHPRRSLGGLKIGLPSDDTQLAAWTLEHLNIHGSLVPDQLAEVFVSRRLFGAGSTIRQFIGNMQSGVSWFQAGPVSAGNGALMRIAPVLIPYLREPSPSLWVDTALAAMITHNDTASIASCLAFVAVLWDVLGMNVSPEGGWWAKRFIEVVQDVEDTSTYKLASRLNSSYMWRFSEFLEYAVRVARENDLTTAQAESLTGSGAYLLETVPTVLSILERHGHDPEEAIIRAVNDAYDNDTIGAIVGAAVGALHGAERLPKRWKTGLTGRTGPSDDGRLFDLLEDARSRFGSREIAQFG